MIHRAPEGVTLLVDRGHHSSRYHLFPVDHAGADWHMLGRICVTISRSFRKTRSPADEQEFFHIAVAHAEAKVEPVGVTDDLRREAVVLIGAG
jgi:hypothetical protein